MHRNLKWVDRANLAAQTGMPFAQLTSVARAADSLYQEVEKNTKGKTRKLSVPTKPLKTIQTNIYRRVLRRFSYRHDVYCVVGRGALDAAKKHAHHPSILNLDIADFFPSVSATCVRRAFAAAGVPDNVVPTLTRLLTYNNQLPQGAATSVAVGNLVLRRLDDSLGTLCSQEGFTYTRYVDDLTISGGQRLAQFEKLIRRIVVDCGWQLNEKGGLLGPEQRHRVLGIVVNAEPNVDRTYYRDLQLILKVAASTPGLLTDAQWRQLLGRVYWVAHVNPRRGARLVTMYNAAVQARLEPLSRRRAVRLLT